MPHDIITLIQQTDISKIPRQEVQQEDKDAVIRLTNGQIEYGSKQQGTTEKIAKWSFHVVRSFFNGSDQTYMSYLQDQEKLECHQAVERINKGLRYRTVCPFEYTELTGPLNYGQLTQHLKENEQRYGLDQASIEQQKNLKEKMARLLIDESLKYHPCKGTELYNHLLLAICRYQLRSAYQVDGLAEHLKTTDNYKALSRANKKILDRVLDEVKIRMEQFHSMNLSQNQSREETPSGGQSVLSGIPPQDIALMEKSLKKEQNSFPENNTDQPVTYSETTINATLRCDSGTKDNTDEMDTGLPASNKQYNDSSSRLSPQPAAENKPVTNPDFDKTAYQMNDTLDSEPMASTSNNEDTDLKKKDSCEICFDSIEESMKRYTIHEDGSKIHLYDENCFKGLNEKFLKQGLRKTHKPKCPHCKTLLQHTASDTEDKSRIRYRKDFTAISYTSRSEVESAQKHLKHSISLKDKNSDQDQPPKKRQCLNRLNSTDS